jgi:flagellar basal body-associated protein FliL
MPERKQTQAQTSQTSKTWWVPLVVGIMMLFIPGGLYVAPVMFLIAIIVKRRRKSKEPPETPHSLLPLINTQP